MSNQIVPAPEAEPGQARAELAAPSSQTEVGLAFRQRWDRLDAFLCAAMTHRALEKPDGPGWIPSELRADVGACIDQIETGIAGIVHYGRYTRVMDYNTAMHPVEQFVRHRAMFDYLGKIGLSEHYFNGRETSLNELKTRSEESLSEPEAASWTVKIGFIPWSRFGKHILLSAEYRVSDDMEGHRYSLIGFWHRSRN